MGIERIFGAWRLRNRFELVGLAPLRAVTGRASVRGQDLGMSFGFCPTFRFGGGRRLSGKGNRRLSRAKAVITERQKWIERKNASS
jgi:hypothetical protein